MKARNTLIFWCCLNFCDKETSCCRLPASVGGKTPSSYHEGMACMTRRKYNYFVSFNQ